MSLYHTIDTLQQWLDSYLNFEKTPQKNIFWLDTMQFLCERFGHPEHCAQAFHIAGSKGKGSVSAFVSSILDAAGYKTGLYTSPHILDFIERIGSAHSTFSESVYADAARELTEGIDSLSDAMLPGGRRITWFELVTLYAFLCFKAAHVDYGVYEVGLGGRLDATNVLSPQACCITPIELEHTEFLGNTLEAIAAEKAGIIKPEVPVFIARQKNKKVADVFRRIAKEKHAPLYFIHEQSMSTKIAYIANKYDYKNDHSKLNSAEKYTCKDLCNAYQMQLTLTAPCFSRPLHTKLQLLGDFQAQNAALAAFAVKTVLPTIDETCIENGLAAARLPGRFEILSPLSAYSAIPAVVLDGAHTVNSVSFTLHTFQTVFGQQEAHLLFACAADKDMLGMAQLCNSAEHGLQNRFSHITLTKPGNVKQSNLPALCHAFESAGLQYTCNEDFVAAINHALEAAEKTGACLLVMGSFYLLAEVKKLLLAHS